jgi:hypothetical protein
MGGDIQGDWPASHGACRFQEGAHQRLHTGAAESKTRQ